MAGKTSNTPDVTDRDRAPISRITPFQMMVRAMSFDASSDEGQYAGEDLNAILEAETEADVWEADERPPINFQHLAGCEIEVLDVNVKYSRNGNDAIKSSFVYEGKAMYVLAKCVRLSGGNSTLIRLPEIGTEFTANTSARYVVAKLWRFLSMGLIDQEAGKTIQCMVQSTDLGAGEAVIKLRPIPRRAMQLPVE